MSIVVLVPERERGFIVAPGTRFSPGVDPTPNSTSGEAGASLRFVVLSRIHKYTSVWYDRVPKFLPGRPVSPTTKKVRLTPKLQDFRK